LFITQNGAKLSAGKLIGIIICSSRDGGRALCVPMKAQLRLMAFWRRQPRNCGFRLPRNAQRVVREWIREKLHGRPTDRPPRWRTGRGHAVYSRDRVECSAAGGQDLVAWRARSHADARRRCRRTHITWIK